MTYTGHMSDGQVVFDGPAPPDGLAVRVVPDGGPRPLAALLAALDQLPANPDWPADGASRLDHYLYGTPNPS